MSPRNWEWPENLPEKRRPAAGLANRAPCRAERRCQAAHYQPGKPLVPGCRTKKQRPRRQFPASGLSRFRRSPPPAYRRDPLRGRPRQSCRWRFFHRHLYQVHLPEFLRCRLAPQGQLHPRVHYWVLLHQSRQPRWLDRSLVSRSYPRLRPVPSELSRAPNHREHRGFCRCRMGQGQRFRYPWHLRCQPRRPTPRKVPSPEPPMFHPINQNHYRESSERVSRGALPSWTAFLRGRHPSALPARGWSLNHQKPAGERCLG